MAGGPAASGSIIKQIIAPADPKKTEHNLVNQVRKTLAGRSGPKAASNPMSNTFYQSDPTDSTAEDLDFARVTYFDRSAAFGFSGEDKLGRLAEINKHQLESVMRDMHGFRNTENNFNRSPFSKVIKPAKPSPLKIDTKKPSQQSMSHLQVEKQISDHYFGQKTINSAQMRSDSNNGLKFQ